MKKIGIMTFHASHNNGSMLQALALQSILEKRYGCDVEIIDFSNTGQRNMYSVLPKADNYKRVIKNVIWSTQYLQLKKQYDAYSAFMKKYFKLSLKSYEMAEELSELDGRYDAVIAGSDQVWNILCRDADDAYYLNFLKNTPKYAYAVSFGANNPYEIDGDKETHKKLTLEFKKVSVREKNAQKWVKEATNIDVSICLDPTMLLDEDEWTRIVDIGDKPIIKGKYIYYYCFSIDWHTQVFLKNLCEKTGLPVYFMEAKEWTLKCLWANKIKLIKEYGPDVYMNVVKNAEMFVTTSFHGTAFATIFKKNFWYINDGKSNKKDDRAVSFLSQLGLMDRYKTIEELMTIELSQKPDFEQAFTKLGDLRTSSYKYLTDVIDDVQEK